MRDETLDTNEDPHRPSVGDQVYDWNRYARHKWPDAPCQPNGYIREVIDEGLILASFYDEPEETETLIHLDKMDWHSIHKRWYIHQRPSTFFRDKLAIYRARKAGLIPAEERP